MAAPFCFVRGKGMTDQVNWPRLIPELMVSGFERSLRFYRDMLGFSLQYSREDPLFAMLDLDNVLIMIEQEHDDPVWSAGPREAPYGRGVNFQIEVSDVEGLYRQVLDADWPLRLDLQDAWYDIGEQREGGNRQFMISDPDGYLLRFFQDLGRRPKPAHDRPV